MFRNTDPLYYDSPIGRGEFSGECGTTLCNRVQQLDLSPLLHARMRRLVQA